MPDTSTSLLDRLRSQADAASWQRLVELYSPLIRGWLRRHGLADHDSDDLVQEVLSVVMRRIPEFRRNERTGSFRRWLRTITVNCVRDFWRSKRARPLATGDSNILKMLEELEDPGSGLSRLWDEEHDRHVAGRLLELIQHDFEPTTWKAFRRLVLDGAAPEVVATELEITTNAVYIAKSRVLSRLRQEGEGLID